MTSAARALALLMILASPFGEGGRLPGILAVLHSLALVLIVLSAIEVLARNGGGTIRGRGIGLLLLPATALLLACLSAAHAGYPYAAWLGVMDRLAVAGALFGAALLLRASGDPPLLRGATVVATSLAALAALRGWKDGPDAPVPFLNHNHLAAYINLGLFLCAAAAAGERERGRRRPALLWSSLGALHLLASLLLQSRGALLGLATGGGILLALSWRRVGARARAASATALLLALVAGGALLYERFARSVDPDRFARLSIWEAGVGIVKEVPLLGLGPGNLPHEAPRHNFARSAEPVRFGRSFRGAHSALLTHAAEDGVPAAFLLLVGALGSIALLWRRSGEGRLSDISRGTALAMAALLAQGMVEDLQARPALIMTSALLLGSSLAASRGWRVERGPARPRALVSVALLLGGFYVGVAGIARPYFGWRSAESARAAGRAGLPAMRRAASLDDWNAEYHHDLAMAALNSAPPGPEPYAEAMEELQRARRRKPRDPRFPLLMARLESRAGRLIFDDVSRDSAAVRMYAEATRLAPTDPRPWLERAGHLAALGRPDDALPILDGALAIEPHYRRARIMKTALLFRLGRSGEASASYDQLLATDRVLSSYQPDSGYASEIASDEPGERAAVEAALQSGGKLAAGSVTN